MAKPIRRQPALLPDPLDWLEASWALLLPFTLVHTFRAENYAEGNRCTIRAELPGMDPDKDIEITAEDGTLTIHAERRDEHKEPRRSEFRYGSFTRTLPLPARADTGHITAIYDKGILTVSVPVPEAKPAERQIKITKGS